MPTNVESAFDPLILGSLTHHSLQLASILALALHKEIHVHHSRPFANPQSVHLSLLTR